MKNIVGSQGAFELLVRAIVLLTAIPIHEFAHAFVADKLGDPTARNLGRLTINPLAHLDLFGSLLMLLTGFGWAKPVPVSAGNFKNVKRDMAITSLAGPVSNLLLALLSMVAFKGILLLGSVGVLEGISPNVVYAMTQMLLIMLSINISLALFNLLPVPPLDGSRLLTALLPYKLYYGVMKYERIIMAVLFVGLLTGVLSVPLNAASHWMLGALDFLTGFMGRVVP
ncbi:MAG: site-2 protease family protein [Angelakisella sp.]